MKYIIRYSKDAKNDFMNIKRYIKYDLKEPDIAEKLIYKIKNKIEDLKDNPTMFLIIEENRLKELKIRKIIVDNYIVFYRVKNSIIEIVRIIYGKRNWITLL